MTARWQPHLSNAVADAIRFRLQREKMDEDRRRFDEMMAFRRSQATGRGGGGRGRGGAGAGGDGAAHWRSREALTKEGTNPFEGVLRTGGSVRPEELDRTPRAEAASRLGLDPGRLQALAQQRTEVPMAGGPPGAEESAMIPGDVAAMWEAQRRRRRKPTPQDEEVLAQRPESPWAGQPEIWRPQATVETDPKKMEVTDPLDDLLSQVTVGGSIEDGRGAEGTFGVTALEEQALDRRGRELFGEAPPEIPARMEVLPRQLGMLRPDEPESNALRAAQAAINRARFEEFYPGVRGAAELGEQEAPRAREAAEDLVRGARAPVGPTNLLREYDEDEILGGEAPGPEPASEPRTQAEPEAAPFDAQRQIAIMSAPADIQQQRIQAVLDQASPRQRGLLMDALAEGRTLAERAYIAAVYEDEMTRVDPGRYGARGMSAEGKEKVDQWTARRAREGTVEVGGQTMPRSDFLTLRQQNTDRAIALDRAFEEGRAGPEQVEELTRLLLSDAVDQRRVDAASRDRSRLATPAEKLGMDAARQIYRKIAGREGFGEGLMTEEEFTESVRRRNRAGLSAAQNILQGVRELQRGRRTPRQGGPTPQGTVEPQPQRLVPEQTTPSGVPIPQGMPILEEEEDPLGLGF